MGAESGIWPMMEKQLGSRILCGWYVQGEPWYCSLWHILQGPGEGLVFSLLLDGGFAVYKPVMESFV